MTRSTCQKCNHSASIQTLLLRLDHSDYSESAAATTTEGIDSAAAQATDGDADADEGGTLPDLEGAVRRAAERITINDEDCPAGSAIRCREDHDKRHQD